MERGNLFRLADEVGWDIRLWYEGGKSIGHHRLSHLLKGGMPVLRVAADDHRQQLAVALNLCAGQIVPGIAVSRALASPMRMQSALVATHKRVPIAGFHPRD